MLNEILIKNANENNLKNFSFKILRDKLVALAGLSGSDNSSLAFDTIYAERQRRYVKNLSSYACQSLEQIDDDRLMLAFIKDMRDDKCGVITWEPVHD